MFFNRSEVHCAPDPLPVYVPRTPHPIADLEAFMTSLICDVDTNGPPILAEVGGMTFSLNPMKKA
jgi:hypothetical protein